MHLSRILGLHQEKIQKANASIALLLTALFFISFTVRTDPEAHMVHVSTPQSFPFSLTLFSFPLIAYSAEVVNLMGATA